MSTDSNRVLWAYDRAAMEAEQARILAEVAAGTKGAAPKSDRVNWRLRGRYRRTPKYLPGVGRKRSRLLERDGHGCYLCGVVLDAREYHVDHVAPKAKGGTNHDWNLALCCPRCNYRKRDRIVSFDVATRLPVFNPPMSSGL